MYEEIASSIPCAIRTLSALVCGVATEEPPVLVSWLLPLFVGLPVGDAPFAATNGLVVSPPVALTRLSRKLPLSECWVMVCAGSLEAMSTPGPAAQMKSCAVEEALSLLRQFEPASSRRQHDRPSRASLFPSPPPTKN